MSQKSGQVNGAQDLAPDPRGADAPSVPGADAPSVPETMREASGGGGTPSPDA